MRKIIFRGKSVKTGKWVEGDLTGGDTIHTGHTWQDQDGSGEWWGESVIPETIGQHTGLKDIYGNIIYEGDILMSHGQYCKFIQVVEFHNTVETCGRGWVGVNKVKVELKNGEKITSHTDGFSYFSFPCHCEIIGNIHDNPELINQVK